MIVQGLVNLTIGSTRTRPKVDPALGEMLARRGHCTDVTAITLVDVGTQVLAEIDTIVRT